MEEQIDDQIDLDNDNICGICYAEFLDIDDLKLHIIQYHLDETSKYRFCDFCSRIFTDIESFALHIRNAHLSTFKACKFCTRVYTDIHSLLRHEKKHKRSVYYPKIACSNCIKVFNNKKDLELHEFEKHRDSEDGLMLQYCFPELSSLININIRKFLKGLREDYIYRCLVCEIATPNVSEYLNHLLTNECKSLSCNMCCNVYTWKSRLKEHCKSHMNNDSKVDIGKRQCPKCDNYFHFTKIKSHLKECTSMKCIPCDVSFDSVEKFANHVTTHTHSTPVQFENCKYCRRPFIGLNALYKHIERSHRHNLHLYRYNCIYCNLVFKHPKLLFGHFFTKHRDINPYTCKICNKDYRIRKNFTLHIKLDHKSVGFVEFNSNYHVFFTDKKSEKPFQPRNPDLPESTDRLSGEITDNETEEPVRVTKKKNNKGELRHTDTNAIENVNSNEKISEEVEMIAHEADTDLKINKTQITEDTDRTTVADDKELLVEQRNKSARISDDMMITNDGQCIIGSQYKETTVKLVNVNSDFMTVTETEADQTESEVKKRSRTLKRKIKTQPARTRKRQKTKTFDNSSDDSDVPLSKIVNKKTKRARVRKVKRKIKESAHHNRKTMKFVCFKCDRNCYTYQNYHRHMSLHMKNGHKTCVKCFDKFKTEDELNEHMKTKHSSSKLTETLKMLLDKRKSNKDIEMNNTTSTESIISKTIQKVQPEIHAQATITRVESDKLSVKNFLENFTPDANDSSASKISISNCLSIRQVASDEKRTTIKMTRFKPESILTTERPQLKMPVKFKEEVRQDHKVTIKLVYCDYVTPTLNINSEACNADFNKTIADDYFEGTQDDDRNKNEIIPEVGREILLEDNDGSKTNFLKKTVVLKDLLAYNNVRIGHLAPKAPFYKIVKINDVLQEKKVEPPKPINITLPNGTKLVSVNPLAHLLGEKNVADIPKANPYKHKSYSYKPKMQDFRQAIVKAMKVLDKSPARRKTTKKDDLVK